MMNVSDVPFVLAAIAVAIVVTGATFFLLRAFKIESRLLRALSAAAFPALLVAIIVDVEVWNPDPHGFVIVGLGLLALMSLPVTILTATFLARRFA